MNQNGLTLYGIASVPIILGIVQAAKNAGLPSHWAPLLAIALGIAAGVVAQATLASPNWLQGAVVGVAVGLSASGLYSSAVTYASASTSQPAATTPPIEADAAVAAAPPEDTTTIPK